MKLPPPPRTGPDYLGWAGLLVGFGLLIAAYFMLPLTAFGPHHPTLSWIVFSVALVGLSVLLLFQIRQVLLEAEGRPGVQLVFLSAVSMVIFSASYYALSREPGAFIGLNTRTDALYFTVITMSTVGYGDITPATQTTRLLVVLQILYNFVFLAAAASAVSGRVRSQVGVRMRKRGKDGTGGATPEGEGPADP
ncbi:potassium channel family protein [Kitasatospora sp. NPDC050543]|uniref:potassium channel family protein n=1 Tax=Kitasatospora sp. NPDC050543 TaxID=3364054 RepID=UPI0037A78071